MMASVGDKFLDPPIETHFEDLEIEIEVPDDLIVLSGGQLDRATEILTELYDSAISVVFTASYNGIERVIFHQVDPRLSLEEMIVEMGTFLETPEEFYND